LQDRKFEQTDEEGSESYAAWAGRFGDLGGTAYLVVGWSAVFGSLDGDGSLKTI